MTDQMRDELLAERAELIAKNEAATGWGAAVGARSERVKGIDRALAALTATSPGEPPPVAGPACRCHDDVSRKFCLDRDRCTPIAEAQSSTSAPSRPDAGGVRVKPLEWRGPLESFPSTIWEAKTTFGHYVIEEVSASDCPAYEVRLLMSFVAVKDTVDEAKAAAQADYERRVLSALSKPTDAANASAEAREDMADWSDLPKDIYVVGAQRVNAVGFDVHCCSVPMVTAPEVRYVRADMIAVSETSTQSSDNASAEARLREALREKCESVDNISPSEEIGVFDSSGQWIVLWTVDDLRALSAGGGEAKESTVGLNWELSDIARALTCESAHQEKKQ